MMTSKKSPIKKKPDLGISEKETFVGISARTTHSFPVENGMVVVRNCGPGKIYLNVKFEKNV